MAGTVRLRKWWLYTAVFDFAIAVFAAWSHDRLVTAWCVVMGIWMLYPTRSINPKKG